MGRAFEYRRASKEARWGKMSRLFPKLAKSITMAAREGGDDPDSNSKLRTAILNAKAQNMPKDNIEAAIKRASGKDASEISEVNYEGKGPHGVLLFVECATDNTNRSFTSVRTLFNKANGQLVPTGSLEFLFDRKTVVEFSTEEVEIDPEELELNLIDAGLEELELEGNWGVAYGDFTAFGNLTSALEEAGVKIEKSSLERIPNSPVAFDEGQMAEIDAFIEKLEDDEDVQAVFSNIER